MADALSARQQIVDKIKETSNILVTVGDSPSVDELSAALGLTIMLNKLKKHATAVVSGDVPPAITFLDPEKTFENTVDSLRDFIIALDKEKADHLRYKVDGDVVKIFITPYRTTITQDDLEFSQGDYNVELVLALGVRDETHLDKALEAHGKILHDATVATISAGPEVSNLGSIDWHDDSASSLSEMLVSLSEAIKGDKPLLDEQISTALLTGIVAATDRFSNERTSSKVMTMAAQLMAAGANQQLIATKLEEANEIAPEPLGVNEASKDDKPAEDKPQNNDGTTTLDEDTSTKLPKKKDSKPKKEADGTLAISHEKEGDLDEVAEQVAEEEGKKATEEAEATLSKLDQTAKETFQENEEEAAKEAERKLAEELKAVAPAAASTEPQNEPMLGGTLNATTEEAAEQKRRDEDDDRNRTILSHGETGHVDRNAFPETPPPLNATMQQEEETTAPDILSQPVSASNPPYKPEPYVAPLSASLPPAQESPVINPAPAPDDASEQVTPQPPTPAQTLADIDATMRQPHEEARAAIDAAFDAAPATEPTAPSIPGLPPMPDFSTLPPAPPAPSIPDLPPVEGMPPAAPMMDQPLQQPTASDPGQFKIPGQS